MRLWAEIWNGAQTEGLGVVDLASASIVHTLDRAGSLMLDAPATDPNAVKLMRWGRWATVFTDAPRRRQVGAGILMRQNASISAGQKTVTWKCTDALVALQRANTLLARAYDDAPIADVIHDLIALVPGWTVRLDNAAGSTSPRFDGATILDAIITITNLHGYHFRQGGFNQLVFGELGDHSGIRLVDTGHVDQDLHRNERIALIESLSVQEDGAQVVNWLLPFSGPVDGALTLKRSTRDAPYLIETMVGFNGETIYVMRDAASIAEHGEIRVVEGPKTLVFPVSIDQTGFINAANMLYDWAATQLQRRSRPQRNYAATVAKLDSASLVGRKVRLVYKGEVRTSNGQYRLVDEDDDFWVTQQTTAYSLDGTRVSLELSSNSEPPRKPEQMLADILKQRGKLAAQMSVALRTFKDTLVFAGWGDSQTLDFEVNDKAVDVTACRVKLTRENTTTGPDRVRLAVDGVEVPGEYLGPDDGLSETVDIADTVIGLDPVRGEHTLTVTAMYGTGNLIVSIGLYEAVVGVS